ncbi:MAG: hypothetical protein ACI9U2_003820 [Bradymonadia bacterium]|jgi:hypothetical protein
MNWMRLWVVACALSLTVGCAGPTDADVDAGGAGGQGEGGQGGSAGGEGGQGGAGNMGEGGMGGDIDRNQRPELARIGDREAPAESELSIQLSATDPEGAPITYNVRSSLPDGAKFDKGAGRFTWTPRADQEGLIALITFEVSDGELKDQETIQITVVAPGAGVNRPPEVDEIGDQVVTAGQPFDLQVEASDPNGDTLSYALRGDVLPAATLGADTGLFTWTPPVELAGDSLNAEIVVSDGNNETVVAVKFVVREPGNVNPGNLPPIIEDIVDAELRVGEAFVLQLVVEDELPDSLTYLIAGTAPAGAALDANTGRFTWTPVAEQADQAVRVVFRVSDGEFTAAERATFQVRPAEGPMMGMCTPDAEGDEPVRVMPGALLNRTICPAGNTDIYLVAAQANDRIQIDLAFDHAQGDVDIILYPPAGGAPAGISEGLDDFEQIVHVAEAAGDFRLLVYTAGAAETDYTVQVAVEGGGEQCVDDAFENGVGNDERGDAASFAQAQGAEQVICGDDVDWYSLDLVAGTDATITLQFSDAAGDIDAVLHGPDGGEVAASRSSDDNETIVYTPAETGRHSLRVYGFRTERNTYSMQLEMGEPIMCDADRVEPNDSHANAEPFRPELYRNLTFCADADWYKTDVPDGHELQVYISYTGARAPDLSASTAGMAAVPGQTFEVGQGDGCQAGRGACRLLTAPGPVGGGFIHYEVRGLEIGADYDLSVRTQMRAEAGGCMPGAVSCEDIEVCDYDANECVDAFCDAGNCPNGFDCHQEWCIEPCLLGSCDHPDQTCKHLDGTFRCGLPGNEALGGSCIDFTDCAGSFDCLDDASIPNGYCSRECVRDGDCGAGGSCVRFDDGDQLCARSCVFLDDCRDGYGCNVKPRVEGGNRNVCTPGFDI